MTNQPNRSGRSHFAHVTFESLERRKLFAGDGGFLGSMVSEISSQVTSAAQRVKATIAQRQSGAAEQDETTPAPGSIADTIASLKYHAELFGASKDALARAIREAGKENADSYDNALRLLIVSGMGLPAEALTSNLRAKELLQHVADLNLVGADQQPTDRSYWRGVVKNGAEQALASVVADQLGIPEATAKGKVAKDLLQGAADIALVGGDARSLAAWNGLALVKAGKISVEQFAQDFTHGNDIQSHDQAAADAQSQDLKQANDQFSSIVRDGTLGAQFGQHNGQPVSEDAADAAPVQPMPSDPDPAANESTGQFLTATLTDIHNNGDGSGSYTVTIHYPDGTHETRQVTVNADGSSTIIRGDGTTESYAAGSTAMPPESAEGQTAVISSDTDGDGNNDSATFDDGEDDGDDEDDDDGGDHNDGSDDDSSSTADDAAGGGDSNSGDSGSSGDDAQGTPNPETITSNLADGASFYFDTPVGRALVGSLVDPVKSSRGGGAIDPVESPVNHAGAAEFRLRFGGESQIKATGGDIDYPDDHGAHYVILDQHQLEALRIASGGDVGGPEIGVKPVAPQGGDTGGVLPAPTPISPGGATARFSQVQISSQSMRLQGSVSAKLDAASIRP